MNLDFYFNHFNLDTGDIVYKMIYGETGTFPLDINYSGGSSYSFFTNYGRSNSSGNILISSLDNEKNGYVFGTTSSNKFFIESVVSGATLDSFIFDDIPLSKQNSICVAKAGNVFSIYDYDITSKTIRKTQSYSLSPNSLISGESTSILPNYYDSGVFSRNGSLDQILLSSEVYDSETIDKLFLGFQPESEIYQYPYMELASSSDYVTWADTTEVPANVYAFVKNYFYDMLSEYASSSLDRNYVGYFSGNASLGDFYVSGDFYNKVDDCVSSGLMDSYQYQDSLYNLTPFSFIDVVSHEIASGYQITNHFVKFKFSGESEFQFSHYFRNTYEEKVDIVYGEIDTGYYSGYVMGGIYSDSRKMKTLSRNDFVYPSGIGVRKSLNKIDGNLYVDNYSGVRDLFVDGVQDLNFSIGNGYINPSLFGDEAIVDFGTGLNANMSMSSNNFLSGEFYKYGSIVNESNNSWSQFKRLGLNDDYKEVCEYDLIFNKNIKDLSGLTNIFSE